MKHTRKDGRISPPLTASTLRAPQHLSPTQPSQAPSFKAWLPTIAHSSTVARHPVLSLPCPQRARRLPLNLLSMWKDFAVQKGPAWSAHGCPLFMFPAFPMQSPAVFAPANSSAENTLSPDSHSSLPHFRGLPWTPNWKAHPLSLHLYADSFFFHNGYCYQTLIYIFKSV